MRVLVTGGCGFIGSHLVQHMLNQGHEVTIIDNMVGGSPESLGDARENPKLKIVEADISERGDWEKLFAQTDWVAHLAALINILDSINDPRLYFKNNTEGVLNVLEASRAHNVKRFVYTNSGACYGIAETYPTPEDEPKRPQYPYALMKLLGEELVLHWAHVYKLPAVSLRFFNLYGPRCSALFGMFMKQLAEGQPLNLTGDGSQTRDFTYITDIVRAIDAAFLSDKIGEAYNIGSGTTVPVREVAELLGGQIKFIERRAGEMNITFGDIRKARQDLAWEPEVQIEQGVALMLEELKSNRR